jgi:hypothetical protein
LTVADLNAPVVGFARSGKFREAKARARNQRLREWVRDSKEL